MVDEAGARWTEVCLLDQLTPGYGACALVGGRQVAVFLMDDGSLYAIGNHDPFSGANVISRGIVGDLKGHVVVASPIFKQHFDLQTGVCLEDASVVLPVYEARVQNGRVEIKAD